MCVKISEKANDPVGDFDVDFPIGRGRQMDSISSGRRSRRVGQGDKVSRPIGTNGGTAP